MTFRVTIQIWGWVQKYHPECKFFIENGIFDDMKDDWVEVCDALGKPIGGCSDEISHTKHTRAYWTNIDVPDTMSWRDGLGQVLSQAQAKARERKESNAVMALGKARQG